MKFIFTPYYYRVDSPTLAGAASGQTPLLLDQDADFELHEITASTSVDAATDFRPNNFSVQVTDKNNSRIWSSARVSQVEYNPRARLTRPVLLAKRSNINFDFLNLTASTSLVASITFHGFKVYTDNSGR